ncbi:hypothetical protein A2701_02880 [Candidatus Amesbacteria bacterium RIFCSPHIGHO2_01_FULL_47_34]|nr:MAG: hypothetical protein A2701_02880 [Candidatus Amesbacteria bacterium RIFCSPHIGHO2_01_FULL_47_34]OGD10803.1 MAG: hypothetical protein A2395_01415 [Candidatus Amesbacteria bacterium RIFOXYB1_FULL_47_9]
MITVMVLAAVFLAAGTGGAMAATYDISYDGNAFTPATLTINLNDTVVFTNNGSTILELASNPHPTHTDCPVLNVGMIGAGNSAEATFATSGECGFHNHLLSTQAGSITITNLVAPTPTAGPTATPAAGIGGSDTDTTTDETLTQSGSTEWTVYTLLMGTGLILAGWGTKKLFQGNA